MFPNLEWFKNYCELLEKDEDFQTHCKWFKGTVAFRVDQQAFTVVFDRGIVKGVTEALNGYDILINGTLEGWKILLTEKKTINRLYRFGILEIRGDNVEIMKNWKAIFFLTQGMKKVAL